MSTKHLIINGDSRYFILLNKFSWHKSIYIFFIFHLTVFKNFYLFRKKSVSLRFKFVKKLWKKF
jgi:hypothetical protein